MAGMKIIIGIAVINTMEITYESFFESPLIAPEVAIAADTPQIDTALDIIMVSSSSTFNFLQTQYAKYQTDNTTTSAWISPSEPAFRISVNITPVPSSTNPIFTNNSVESVSRSHWGNRKRLPMINPSVRLKITASRLKPLMVLFPAMMSASMV